MPRLFSATGTNTVGATPGALSTLNGGNCTFVALMRFISGTPNFPFPIRAVTSSNADVAGILFNGDTQVGYDAGGSVTSSAAVTLSAADGWGLVGASKASGTAAPRLHVYKFGAGTFAHANAVASLPDASAVGSGGKINFGDPVFSGFDHDLAAVAAFNYVLTDDQFERLPFSLADWLSLSPAGMWVFDQPSTSQAVLDWTGGGANQTSITGTSVSAASVPILGYGHPVIARTRQAPSGGGSVSADAALVVTASLSAAAGRSALASGALSAIATLTAAATQTAVPSASLAVTATLTAAALRTALPAVALSVTATLAATPDRAAVAGPALSATATLTAAGDRTAVASAALSAAATLATAADRTALAPSALAATATLTAAATVSSGPAAVDAALAVAAALTAGPARAALPAAALAAAAVLVTDAASMKPAAAALAVAATLTSSAAIGAAPKIADAALSVAATLTVAVARAGTVDGAMVVTASLTSAVGRAGLPAGALTVTASLAFSTSLVGGVGAALGVAALLIAAGSTVPLIGPSAPGPRIRTTSRTRAIVTTSSARQIRT